MELAIVNETEVLTEANRLVTSGLRHAAIDLLRECLESSPDSPSLHSALGRVYLLVGQPEQAVIYLQRSLEVRQAKKLATQSSPKGQDDDFTDDDLAFVAAQAEQQNETDIPPYDLVPPEASQVGGTDAPQTPSSSIAQVGSRNGGLEAANPDTGETTAEDPCRRRLDSQDGSSRQAHDDEEQLPQEAPSAPGYPSSEPTPETQQFSGNRLVRQPTPPQQTPSSWQTGLAQPDQDASPYPLAELPPQSSEPTENEPDSEPGDLPPGELLLDEPGFVLDLLEESESDEEDFADLVEAVAPFPDDEETDALAWDDNDDLDEFDEEAQRDRPGQSQAEESVPRVMRARQVAVEVLLESDWPLAEMDLLQQIFIENGWGSARLAIEREIKKGLLPEELSLARVIRCYWLENDRFWTTYQRIRTNAPFAQAEAAYRHMSWAEALRIVRCFPAVPAAEEVIGLIEDAYGWWYTDGSLRRSFKTFLKFLKYRTGSMRGTLPGHCFFDFQEWPECDSETESIDLLHSTSPEYQYLQELGIQLPLAGEQPSRNILRIRKEPEE